MKGFLWIAHTHTHTKQGDNHTIKLLFLQLYILIKYRSQKTNLQFSRLLLFCNNYFRLNPVILSGMQTFLCFLSVYDTLKVTIWRPTVRQWGVTDLIFNSKSRLKYEVHLQLFCTTSVTILLCLLYLFFSWYNALRANVQVHCGDNAKRVYQSKTRYSLLCLRLSPIWRPEYTQFVFLEAVDQNPFFDLLKKSWLL